MTVFEQVVIRLTRAGREFARYDTTFYSVSYDNFVAKIWTDKASTQGLPPEVFVRALKTAYREVTGNAAPPPNSSDQQQQQPKHDVNPLRLGREWSWTKEKTPYYNADPPTDFADGPIPPKK